MRFVCPLYFEWNRHSTARAYFCSHTGEIRVKCVENVLVSVFCSGISGTEGTSCDSLSAMQRILQKTIDSVKKMTKSTDNFFNSCILRNSKFHQILKKVNIVNINKVKTTFIGHEIVNCKTKTRRNVHRMQITSFPSWLFSIFYWNVAIN